MEYFLQLPLLEGYLHRQVSVSYLPEVVGIPGCVLPNRLSRPCFGRAVEQNRCGQAPPGLQASRPCQLRPPGVQVQEELDWGWQGGLGGLASQHL